MNYFVGLVVVIYIIFYYVATRSRSNPPKTKNVKDDNFIPHTKADWKVKKPMALHETFKLWKTCPTQDGSLDSIFISMGIDQRSGLGNQVWSYLSVWAIARRHNIRPILPEHNLNKIAKMFERKHLNIPSLRTVGIKCKLFPWTQDEYVHGTNSFGTPKQLFRKLQVPLKQNVTMIKVGTYHFDFFHAVPMWNELTNDLVVRKKLRNHANQILKDIRRDFFYSLKKNGSKVALSEIEFVSAHIRRVGYDTHMNAVYKGKNASMVDERFYLHAFKWLKQQVNKTLVMIVVSDDMKWARDKLANGRPDVFMPGSGVYSSPYEDLALLAACNHSVFAYGTFGLTGAFLARGGYTIVFDTGKNSISPETRVASTLPRWYIMDQNGTLKFENEIL